MKNYLFLLSIICLINLVGCQSNQVDENLPESINYVEPSELILEITKKVGSNKNIEAAELNLELANEKDLSKKAELLMKINKINNDNLKSK